MDAASAVSARQVILEVVGCELSFVNCELLIVCAMRRRRLSDGFEYFHAVSLVDPISACREFSTPIDYEIIVTWILSVIVQ